jgi:arylsulfatase A-like enzyme
VVWDTCRGDRVSVNGYPLPTTPLLDAFAAGGVVYRRCYTPAPWTPPAHGSLFTGLLPRRHGLIEGMGDRLRPGLPTLASTLRAAGYETVCISANPLISDATGLTAGFETVLPCYRTGDDAVTGVEAVANVRQWLLRRRTTPLPRRPFFLFVNLMDTHLPYVFDGEGVTAVHGAAEREPARRAVASTSDMDARFHLMGQKLLHPDQILHLSRAYDGAVRRDDRTTGQMLELLRAEGLGADALVAVCGDHGENLGEHGEMDHAFSVHDTVCRVPLVVRQAGRFEGGKVVEGPVALQDLYPTLLAAAGATGPPVCGADAVMLGDAAVPGRVVVSEYGPMPRSLLEASEAMPGAPPEVMARFRWRYRAARTWTPGAGGRTLLTTEKAGDDGSWTIVTEALFDPDADPGEDRNLLGPGERPEDRASADRLRKAAAE